MYPCWMQNICLKKIHQYKHRKTHYKTMTWALHLHLYDLFVTNNLATDISAFHYKHQQKSIHSWVSFPVWKMQNFETSKFQSVFVQLHVWIRCPTDFRHFFCWLKEYSSKLHVCLHWRDNNMQEFLFFFSFLDWNEIFQENFVAYPIMSICTPFSWVGGIQF